MVRFCRVVKRKDLVLDVLSDIRLSSAQDTVLATSFNCVLTEVTEGPQTRIVVSSANIVEFTPESSSNGKSLM